VCAVLSALATSWCQGQIECNWWRCKLRLCESCIEVLYSKFHCQWHSYIPSLCDHFNRPTIQSSVAGMLSGSQVQYSKSISSWAVIGTEVFFFLSANSVHFSRSLAFTSAQFHILCTIFNPFLDRVLLKCQIPSNLCSIVQYMNTQSAHMSLFWQRCLCFIEHPFLQYTKYNLPNLTHYGTFSFCHSSFSAFNHSKVCRQGSQPTLHCTCPQWHHHAQHAVLQVFTIRGSSLWPNCLDIFFLVDKLICFTWYPCNLWCICSPATRIKLWLYMTRPDVCKFQGRNSALQVEVDNNQSQRVAFHLDAQISALFQL